jgi:hypothetical protein
MRPRSPNTVRPTIIGLILAPGGRVVAVPLVALDLPLRILVWDDGNGTSISFTAPCEAGIRSRVSRRRSSEDRRERRAGIAERLTGRVGRYISGALDKTSGAPRHDGGRARPEGGTTVTTER